VQADLQVHEADVIVYVEVSLKHGGKKENYEIRPFGFNTKKQKQKKNKNFTAW
jgi:hypothetical protein